MTTPNLVDGLKEMIKAGRLKEVDIPDDFIWLKKAIREAEKTIIVTFYDGCADDVPDNVEIREYGDLSYCDDEAPTYLDDDGKEYMIIG